MAREDYNRFNVQQIEDGYQRGMVAWHDTTQGVRDRYIRTARAARQQQQRQRLLDSMSPAAQDAMRKLNPEL